MRVPHHLTGRGHGGDVQDEAQDRPDTVWLGRGGRLLQAKQLPGGVAADARGDPGLERGWGGRDRPAPRDLLRRSPPASGHSRRGPSHRAGLVAPRSRPTRRRALQRRRGPVRWASRPRRRAPPWPARSPGVLLDRHQPRRGRMSGVGAAHDPLPALLVPQPNLGGPGARLDLVQRPAPAADGAPRRAGPRAEALAEVVRADRPFQTAQRPLIAPQHPAHRPFRSHHAGT